MEKLDKYINIAKSAKTPDNPFDDSIADSLLEELDSRSRAVSIKKGVYIASIASSVAIIGLLAIWRFNSGSAKYSEAPPTAIEKIEKSEIKTEINETQKDKPTENKQNDTNNPTDEQELS